MPDKYQALREAAEKATPGPWVAKDVSGAGLEIHMAAPEPYQDKRWPGFSTANADVKKDLIAYETWVQFPSEKLNNVQARNAIYIAAAGPDVIQALLAERDALKDALRESAAALQAIIKAGTRANEAGEIIMDGKTITIREILDKSDAVLAL